MVNFINPVTNMKSAGGVKRYVHNITLAETYNSNYNAYIVRWFSEDSAPITTLDAFFTLLKEAGHYSFIGKEEGGVSDNDLPHYVKSWYPVFVAGENVVSGVAAVEEESDYSSISNTKSIVVYNVLVVSTKASSSYYSVTDIVTEL